MPFNPRRRFGDVEGGDGQKEVVRRDAKHDKIVDDATGLVQEATVKAPPRNGLNIGGANFLDGPMGVLALDINLAHLVTIKDHRR